MILSWWATALWQICMHHWRGTSRSKISKIANRCQNWGNQSSFIFWCQSQKCKFCIDMFHGFSCNIKCLQSFQMHIYNRKYSKWTFSNDSQLMGNSFIANLHASLESTCKSKISKIATTCQNQGGQSSFNFWCWSQKCKFGIDIFHGVSSNIKHITAISNVHLQ